MLFTKTSSETTTFVCKSLKTHSKVNTFASTFIDKSLVLALPAAGQVKSNENAMVFNCFYRNVLKTQCVFYVLGDSAHNRKIR